MHPVLAFTAVLCIAVGAGGAGALNMWYEADLDAKMKRTAKRPLPGGRLNPKPPSSSRSPCASAAWC
jgi:protoheme IX farnesyltransferase